MEIKKYPDGTSYVVGSEEDLENLGCTTYHYRVNSYEDLWHLNQWVDAYNTCNFGMTPSITIPNLIDAQADRRFHKNHSSGLKLVCNFLNSIPASFRIFHPHNPEVVEALMNDVEIIDNSDFINKVMFDSFGRTVNNHDTDNDLIMMSSDAGGFKPLMKLCDTINWEGEVYSASKSRNSSTGELIQLIDREDFGGCDILIVDDICVYGGTFKGLASMLRERNCGKLYLAVSHMTIQNLGINPVTDYFDKVFTTNSKYNKYVFPAPSGYMGESAINDGGLCYPSNLNVIKLFDV